MRVQARSPAAHAVHDRDAGRGVDAGSCRCWRRRAGRQLVSPTTTGSWLRLGPTAPHDHGPCPQAAGRTLAVCRHGSHAGRRPVHLSPGVPGSAGTAASAGLGDLRPRYFRVARRREEDGSRTAPEMWCPQQTGSGDGPCGAPVTARTSWVCAARRDRCKRVPTRQHQRPVRTLEEDRSCCRPDRTGRLTGEPPQEVDGRKRPAVADTIGLPLVLQVHPANEQAGSGWCAGRQRRTGNGLAGRVPGLSGRRVQRSKAGQGLDEDARRPGPCDRAEPRGTEGLRGASATLGRGAVPWLAGMLLAPGEGLRTPSGELAGMAAVGLRPHPGTAPQTGRNPRQKTNHADYAGS